MRAKDAREIAEFAMKQKEVARRKDKENRQAALMEVAKKEFPDAIAALYHKIEKQAGDGQICLHTPDSCYSEALSELIRKDLADNGFICSAKQITREDDNRETYWEITW